MTPVDPAGDLRELIAAHLADELSDAQRSTLNALLRKDEKARAEFAAALRQDVLLGEVLREEAAHGAGMPWPAQRKTTGEPESPSRRRTARRLEIHPSIPSWIGLLVPAGFVIAVAMFLALGPSDPDPAAARARALKEAEGRKLEERERALALAEARHRDAVERLREIEKKSQELLQPPARPNPNPLEEDLRKKKRAELQEEKERVEQVEREMRGAIELAKKTKLRVPTEQARDEKVPPPQESPGVTQKLTTQMVIARLEEAAGQVFLVTKEGKTPVTSGGNLLPAQGLETGGGASRLVLRFPDNTRVELGPETELGEIKTDSGKRLWMGKGTLQAQVFQQPKDQPMIFATPYGEAKVLGTTLRITVDPDSRKGTRLEVDEGKVELKNAAGKAVLVEGWHYAVAAEGVDFVANKQDAPTNVPRSGLAVWLRADQGVILSGSRGVATWVDRSGNKHDAVQLVPTQQPTLVPNAVQGHPALRFDGVDDCMTFPCTVSGLTGMTILMVSSTLEERAAANYAANAALYWQETATCSGVALNPSQSKVWCYFGTGQVQPLLVYSRPTALDRGFSLTTAQKSGPEVLLFVNGQESLRIRGQKSAIGANEKTGQIGRGEGDLVTNRQFQGQREGWTYFSGEIAELMVYTRTLGEVERKSVEQYLLSKYLSK
jgi:hypothetical protein